MPVVGGRPILTGKVRVWCRHAKEKRKHTVFVMDGSSSPRLCSCCENLFPGQDETVCPDCTE